MAEIKKVLANHSQTFTSAEQQKARTNIGANKVAFVQAPTQTDTTSEAGTTLVLNIATITPTKRSLLILSLYTALTLQDTSSPADLSTLIEASPAIKMGGSDGDSSLSNASCSYSGASATTLKKFSNFYTVLDANQPVTLKGTFTSSVGGFNVTHSLNYTIITLE